MLEAQVSEGRGMGPFIQGMQYVPSLHFSWQGNGILWGYITSQLETFRLVAPAHEPHFLSLS